MWGYVGTLSTIVIDCTMNLDEYSLRFSESLKSKTCAILI